MTEASLTEFISTVCNESRLRVETDLGGGFVRLKSEEAERRQAAHDIRCTEDALIELLRNSRDAHARILFVATAKSADERSLVVIDDGDGIPEAMHELVFEPRVTSKLDSVHFDKWGVHGRGMALYSVKTNAKTAFVCDSAPGKGCALSAAFDTNTIVEKADQSTFPQFMLGENNTVKIRGPKNLARTASEFAFEHRDTLSVYFGSFSEIAATLYAFGKSSLSLLDRTFAQGTQDLPLVKRLCVAADEESFCEIAAELGLHLSERTAHRILMGQIKTLDSLMDGIQAQLLTQLATQDQAQQEQASKKRSSKGSSFAVKMSSQDLNDFEQAIRADYAQLAQSYYLNAHVDPQARVRGSELVVRIPLIPEA